MSNHDTLNLDKCPEKKVKLQKKLLFPGLFKADKILVKAYILKKVLCVGGINCLTF